MGMGHATGFCDVPVERLIRNMPAEFMSTMFIPGMFIPGIAFWSGGALFPPSCAAARWTEKPASRNKTQSCILPRKVDFSPKKRKPSAAARVAADANSTLVYRRGSNSKDDGREVLQLGWREV